MGRGEPSGVDSAAMFSISSYCVACAAMLMVRLLFVCEYVCVSVILFLRVRMGSMCACMVAFCLFFLMHVRITHVW